MLMYSLNSRDIRRRPKVPSIHLDHLLIPVCDRVASAKLLASLLGVPWAETGVGPFSPVYVNDGLTLDFDQADSAYPVQHYCFRVGEFEFEFDAILGRIRAAGLPYRSAVHGPIDMQVDTAHGGRIVYWNAPDVHQWELLTESYAREPGLRVSHPVTPSQSPRSTRLDSAVPKLASQNIEHSLAFYARLGFSKVSNYPDYGIVQRDGVQIHFWLCADPRIARATGCRINVEGIEALYSRYSAEDVIHPNDPMSTKPWGLREFSILDADGNLVTFAEPPVQEDGRVMP